MAGETLGLLDSTTKKRLVQPMLDQTEHLLKAYVIISNPHVFLSGPSLYKRTHPNGWYVYCGAHPRRAPTPHVFTQRLIKGWRGVI